MSDPTIQKPVSFSGTGTTAGGQLTEQQIYQEALQYGTLPSSRPSPTTISEEPLNSLLSANPAEQVTAWDLPPNAGALRLPSGVATSTPANPKAQSTVTAGLEMLQLYGKFENGVALTSEDVAAATRIGGDVARAAQLLGKAKVTPARPHGTPQPNGVTLFPTKAKTTPAAGTQKALIDANAELAKRIETTLGIPTEDLVSGFKGRVPKQLASTMQNAGYAVTSNMTFDQALGIAVGPNAQPPMANISGNQTVSQYIQGLGQMTKAELEPIQQALYQGGFFDDSYYSGKNFTQGVLDTGTILAFRKAILQTLANNASGKTTSLEQTITGGNSAFPLIPAVPAGAALGAPKNPTAPMATTAQTQQPLISAFQAALGRAPSQAELQAFTSSYTNQLDQGSKTLTEAGLSPNGIVDYSTGIPFVQGTPTVSAAATSYAENQDPNEYQGHGIANAFGLLMKLIDRPGTSALDSPGASPTAVA